MVTRVQRRKAIAFGRVHHLVFLPQRIGVGHDECVLQRNLRVIQLGGPSVHAGGGYWISLGVFIRKLFAVKGLYALALGLERIGFGQLCIVCVGLAQTLVSINHCRTAREGLHRRHQAAKVLRHLLFAHLAHRCELRLHGLGQCFFRELHCTATHHEGGKQGWYHGKCRSAP